MSIKKSFRNYFTFERHFIIINSIGNFTDSVNLQAKVVQNFCETVKNNCCGYWDKCDTTL